MRLWHAAAALLAAMLASCSDTPSFYGEEFSQFYGPPAAETKIERVERRAVYHWKDNPRDKKRIAFLYKYETQVKGSRAYRDSWQIYDRLGKKAVGFITAEGQFYRFQADGRREEKPIGEWQIVSTGLKVFFDLPLRDNVDVVEIDPYE